jgi:hypothetical protein
MQCFANPVLVSMPSQAVLLFVLLHVSLCAGSESSGRQRRRLQLSPYNPAVFSAVVDLSKFLGSQFIDYKDAQKEAKESDPCFFKKRTVTVKAGTVYKYSCTSTTNFTVKGSVDTAAGLTNTFVGIKTKEENLRYAVVL